MSRINEGLYSSSAHDWMTPPDFIETLLTFLGRTQFDIDVCCTQENVPAKVHCKEHEVDSLNVCWHAPMALQPFPADPIAWMNPPYGNALPKFVKKAYEESLQGCRIWGLIPARPDTRYWHEHVLTYGSFVYFLQGRLKFLKDGQLQKGDGTAPFPTALVYWGTDWVNTAKRFAAEPPFKGTLLTKVGGRTK